MGALIRRCYFLLIVWNIAAGSPVVISGNDLIVASPSNEDECRIVCINPKFISNDIVTDLETRLSKIEGKLKKFTDEDRDQERTSVARDDKEDDLHRSTESQMTAKQTTTERRFPVEKVGKVDYTNDIVDSIQSNDFVKAEKKLIAMGEDADIAKIVHEAYGDFETKFGSILHFGRGLSNTTTSFKVFKSLANEMQVYGKQDPFKLISLAKALRAKVLIQHLDPDVIKADAVALIKGLDYNITTITTEYLANAMESSEYQTKAKVHFLAEIIDDYRSSLSGDIMRALVDITYETITAKHILLNIVSHTKINQAISGIIELFEKMKSAGHLNNSAVLDLAFHLSKLRKRIDYQTLAPTTLRAVDRVVENIPTCARSLFFEQHVCLWNKAQQAYLYAADSTANYDKDRRRIFVSPFLHRVAFGTAWLVEKVGDNILFKSARYVNEYLYAAEFEHSPGERFVFNWIPGKNTDTQSEWNIELDGDYCSIKSAYFNERLYASPETYVFTHKSDSTALWQIRSCSV